MEEASAESRMLGILGAEGVMHLNLSVSKVTVKKNNNTEGGHLKEDSELTLDKLSLSALSANLGSLELSSTEDSSSKSNSNVLSLQEKDGVRLELTNFL